MKVLQVYRTYFPDTQGGAEEVVRQICRTTKPLGVESRVFYPSSTPDPKVLETNEAKVIRVKKQFEVASCGFCLGGFGEFSRQADWADIIHYHFPWPFADVMHLGTRVNKPSVLTYHSDVVRQQWLGKVYQPIMDRFLNSMSQIVATSENYALSSETLSIFEDKVSVIPLGVDESAYPTPSESDLKRVENEFGRDFFLFVGVWRYYKGLQFLLEALQDRPYAAVIAGSGPEEMAIKEKASMLGLDNVTFPGQIDDLTKVCLMKLCRGFVLPSHLRSEAFGVTLLESAMTGKPMISTDIGTGTSYINSDQETGIVVPPGDSNALRSAMDSLYQDSEKAESLGENARQRYLDYFTGARMGQSYVSMYQKLLKNTSQISTETEMA